MREILFRGKRELGNKWIEGSLHTEKFADDEEYLCCEINQCDVYPETVGQYTGLEDKNGKKIFEGDILEFLNDDGDKTLYIVEWDMSFAGWIIRTTEIDCGLDSMECWDEYKEHYEVIGNIHDNGELLEAKG